MWPALQSVRRWLHRITTEELQVWHLLQPIPVMLWVLSMPTAAWLYLQLHNLKGENQETLTSLFPYGFGVGRIPTLVGLFIGFHCCQAACELGLAAFSKPAWVNKGVAECYMREIHATTGDLPAPIRRPAPYEGFVDYGFATRQRHYEESRSTPGRLDDGVLAHWRWDGEETISRCIGPVWRKWLFEVRYLHPSTVAVSEDNWNLDQTPYSHSARVIMFAFLLLPLALLLLFEIFVKIGNMFGWLLVKLPTFDAGAFVGFFGGFLVVLICTSVASPTKGDAHRLKFERRAVLKCFHKEWSGEPRQQLFEGCMKAGRELERTMNRPGSRPEAPASGL